VKQADLAHQLGGGSGGWFGRTTSGWSERHGFDAKVRLVAPGHDANIPEGIGETGGARAWATGRTLSAIAVLANPAKPTASAAALASIFMRHPCAGGRRGFDEPRRRRPASGERRGAAQMWQASRIRVRHRLAHCPFEQGPVALAQRLLVSLIVKVELRRDLLEERPLVELRP
jgi:hypothetical protein